MTRILILNIIMSKHEELIIKKQQLVKTSTASSYSRDARLFVKKQHSSEITQLANLRTKMFSLQLRLNSVLSAVLMRTESAVLQEVKSPLPAANL